MLNIQGVLYLLGIILLIIAAFGVPRSGRISLAILGAAALALGYTLSAIVHPFAV